MKLSDLWPRAGAGKPATPVVSVTVTKRAGAEDKRQPLTGPRELPDTLEACEAMHERLVSDAIRLELALAQALDGAAKGNPCDRGWYNRAKAALKHMNHDRTRLLKRCGELRRDAKAQSQLYMDRAILDVIKEAIPADQFLGFVRIAETRVAQGGAQ